MSPKVIFLFSLFFVVNQLIAQEPIDIIKDLNITKDYSENGVQGIKIDVIYSFDFLKTNYPVDSLREEAMFGSSFNLYIRGSENGKAIAIAMGHKSMGDDKENLRTSTIVPSFAINYEGDKTLSVFVPYASLKLDPTEHKLKLHVTIKGEDGKKIKIQSKEANATITFTKPPTKIFEISLDSLVVNFFDTKGQAWDHSLFGSDSPDLDFNILLGTESVGNIYKGNSYSIVFATKPRIFKFVISEKDDVLLSLKDRDDIFHDEVATWRFISANMKSGNYYEQNQAKANITAFSFRCKIEE